MMNMNKYLIEAAFMSLEDIENDENIKKALKESREREASKRKSKKSLKEMYVDRYKYFKNKINTDFKDLVSSTQDKLSESKSKEEDFKILSEFWTTLLNKDTWDGEEWEELFLDSSARQPMPESVLKQISNMIFEIHNLDVLNDLDIYDGFDLDVGLKEAINRRKEHLKKCAGEPSKNIEFFNHVSTPNASSPSTGIGESLDDDELFEKYAGKNFYCKGTNKKGQIIELLEGNRNFNDSKWRICLEEGTYLNLTGNKLSLRESKEIYHPQKYGMHHYIIINPENGLALRVGNAIDYTKPQTKENKILFFKNKEEAEKYIKDNKLNESKISLDEASNDIKDKIQQLRKKLALPVKEDLKDNKNLQEEVINKKIKNKFNLNDPEEVEEATKISNEEIKKDDLVVIHPLTNHKEPHPGNAILVCNSCKDVFYVDKDELKQDEEDTETYNKDDQCENCGATDGYSYVGDVAVANSESARDAIEERKDIEEDDFVDNENNNELELVDEIDEPEEIVEESFDNLINKYVNRLYENIENYKTTNIKQTQRNKYIVEGVLKDVNEKEHKTSFLLEIKKLGKDNKRMYLRGSNKELIESKSPFRFSAFVTGKKLIFESLKYRYIERLDNKNYLVEGLERNK